MLNGDKFIKSNIVISGIIISIIFVFVYREKQVTNMQCNTSAKCKNNKVYHTV